ncbi:MAG: putative Ig domain-containing protein [Acidobacteriota bacterium]|nr:putative Ig domain-containing protein [Acidobacteriota bacterium]
MFIRMSKLALRWKVSLFAAVFSLGLVALFTANGALLNKVLARKAVNPDSVSSPVATALPGDWVNAASMPTARGVAAASLLPSGRVLVVGGATATQNFITDAAIYGPGNTWQAIAPIPIAHRLGAQLLNTGEVLVVGDDDPNSTFPPSSFLYTETPSGWSATNNAPSLKRYQPALALLTTGSLAGHVLMTGGYDNNSATGPNGTYKTTELYNPNPANKTWSAGPPMNVARFLHTATTLNDGRVLVVGGAQRDPLTPYNSAELYTPGSSSWTVATPMAAARYAHTATLLPSGKVLVVGGVNSTTTLNSVELYDPISGTWSTKAPIVVARHRHTATLLPSGKVLIAGGQNLAGVQTNSAELYDPAMEQWSDAGPMNSARGRHHIAALLSCGRVLVAGGTTGNNVHLASAEIYTQKDPLITLTPTTLANGVVGQMFMQQFSPAGGAAPFTYSLSGGTLPTGVTLQPDGKLTGIPEAAGNFNFTVKATDKNGCMGTVAITWQIACPNIVISPTTLHDGIAGQSYSPVEQLTSTGGTAPYSYAVTAGLLPSGMQLTSDGKLQGTPLQTGAFSFNVTVTDKFGCTGIRDYSLTINCGITGITPDVMQLPDGIRGATYAPTGLQFSTVGGCGMNTFTISAGQLPPGLTLNPNGTFSGAPVLTGDFTFTVKVTDKCGCMATREYKLKVICTTKNCGCVEPPPRNEDMISWWPMDGNGNDIRGAHHALPQGTGGTFPAGIVGPGILTTANHWLEAPHHDDFNVNQFTLDAWITINQFNTSNMPLVWKGNGGGQSVTGSFGLGVSGFPNTVTPFRRLFLDISDGDTFQEVVSTAELPVNVPTHVAATVSLTQVCLLINGQVDTCVARTLPPMQSTNFPIQIGGLTGGTATAPLVQFFNGVIDEVELWRVALTPEELRSIFLAGSAGKCKPSPCAGVTLSLASTPSTIPIGMTGQPFPTTMFMASGGTGPYMYSATGLPPGLSLSMDGKLTGIPTQQNTFPVQITVKDANGCMAVFTQPIEVKCTPYTIQPAALPAGTAGKPYPKQTLTNNSPCPIVTYSVTGTLPPGLSFMDGMLQGTPTLKGVYSFTVTATDNCGCPSTKNYTIEVICNLTITPNNLPAGFVGSVYPKQTFTTDSMCPPVTYSVVGTLPPGLNFDGGMLQGTPSTAGTFTFTVAAVDLCGCSLTKPYTIVIKDCPVVDLKLFNTGVANTTNNNPIKLPLGVPDGHYSAVTPSPTLTPVSPVVIDPPNTWATSSTAAWIGRPGIPGGLRYTANFELNGCDLSSVLISGRFAANASGQLFLNSSTTPIATSSGPTGFTTFTITSGFQAGPNKLTFVTAAAAGQVSALLVEITEARAKCCACPTITLGPIDLPEGKDGGLYGPVSLTAIGGMPSYTYSIIGGALPIGMTLSSAGVLSGPTPVLVPEKATFVFKVLVVDAMGCTGMREYKLVIKKRTLGWGGDTSVNFAFGAEQTKQLTLRVNLEAFGNEKAVSLSLGFNTAILSNPRVTLGADATGATLNVNTSQVAQGAIGMSLIMPGNQTLAEGSRRIFNIVFDYSDANTGAKLDFTFRDAPVARSVTDTSGAALPTDAVATPVLLAQPATSVSAASYRGEALTSDQIVAVFGINLATTTQVATSVPLPTTLAGTTVKVRDSANVERLAPLFFVAPTQVNYLVPPGTAAGQATILITSGNGAVSGSVVEIANVAPGIFVADASGRGLPAANALTFRADGSSSSRPVAQFDLTTGRFVAVPIDLGAIDDRIFLSLFATGVRGRSSLDAVRAIIGGIEAPVSYAGDQGGFAGLDQINIELPRALAGSGLVDVMLIVDGAIANVVQINIK